MAVDAESFQAVSVKKKLPDEEKESGGDNLVQQMPKQIVVAGLEQVPARRPVCFSLHKYFKTVQPDQPDASLAVQAEQAESVLVAVQTKPPDVRESWKKPLEKAKADLDKEVAMLGCSTEHVQTVPAVRVRNWAGGRPKKASTAAKAKYNSLTGQQKLWLITFIEDQISQPGNSLKRAKAAASFRLKSCAATMAKIWRDRAYWKDWGEKEERKASLRPGSSKRQGQRVSRASLKTSSSGGRRTGSREYLGRTDHCRPFVLATQTWAELEQDQGHQLFRSNLLIRYSDLLDSAIQYDQDAKEAGTFNIDEEAKLAAWLQKQAALNSSKSKRDKQSKYLVAKTGFIERAKQRQTPLTPAQEMERAERGWSHFDYILWLTGCADSPALADWVGQPERFVLNREAIVISQSDQIPVWLKPDAGKPLMSQSLQKAYRASKKGRKSRAAKALEIEVPDDMEGEAAQPRTLALAAGNPANSRARFTFVARQLITKYYSKTQDPEGRN
jgi:hypothetical protein